MSTVLIVDDHASFRAMTREMLELAGYEVVGEATDGPTGVAEALRLRPDVVLLDVQLPGMDGIAAAGELRGSGLDVVLVSSRRADDFGPRLDRAPARGFIAKDELTGPALDSLLTA